MMSMCLFRFYYRGGAGYSVAVFYWLRSVADSRIVRITSDWLLSSAAAICLIRSCVCVRTRTLMQLLLRESGLRIVGRKLTAYVV